MLVRRAALVVLEQPRLPPEATHQVGGGTSMQVRVPPAVEGSLTAVQLMHEPVRVATLIEVDLHGKPGGLPEVGDEHVTGAVITGYHRGGPRHEEVTGQLGEAGENGGAFGHSCPFLEPSCLREDTVVLPTE